MIRGTHGNLKKNDFHGKGTFQQEESFHQETGLELKEDASRVLHL
jgi:hypothetical protein